MAALVATDKMQQFPERVTLFGLFFIKGNLDAGFFPMQTLFLKRMEKCNKKIYFYAEKVTNI